MENGLALPYYSKVIEIADDDAATNRSLLIQAYGYLGAYQANVKKDFPVALENFEKILQLDPGNADATRYTALIQPIPKRAINYRYSLLSILLRLWPGRIFFCG